MFLHFLEGIAAFSVDSCHFCLHVLRVREFSGTRLEPGTSGFVKAAFSCEDCVKDELEVELLEKNVKYHFTDCVHVCYHEYQS